MPVRSYWHLCVLIPALAGAACDEKLSRSGRPDAQPDADLLEHPARDLRHTRSSGRAACIQCHVAGGLAAGTGLISTDGVSYGNLVNAPAASKPGATRVIPGDAGDSYLVRKLEGAPDITGVRMPRSTVRF